jgi:parallel beta-helix repeat protein
MPPTIPPGTAAVGTGNPPADMNNVAQVLAQITGQSLGSALSAGSKIVRTAAIVVAASNATTVELAAADFVCTGTADQIVINAALAALTNGGVVWLSSGTFNLTGPIVFTATAQVVKGSGISSAAAGGTTINHPGCNGFTWNGTSSIWFCSVQDMYCQSGLYGFYFTPLATTVAAGTGTASIATIIAAQSLFVGSVTGFPSSGTIQVVCTGGTATWAYTGINGGANSFTWTGSPTVTYTNTATSASTTATGNVAQSGATFWDFYTRDVFVYGMANDGFYSYDGHGFVLDHFLSEGNTGWGVNFPVTYAQSQPEVRNGTFKVCGGGIYMGCPGGVVAENEFTNITGNAIELWGFGAKATDNTIGVIAPGATGAGIVLRANGTIASGNTVNQCGAQGIISQAYGAVINGNTSYQNTGPNIYATVQTAITGNFTQFGASYGIQVNSGANSTVTGNYVHAPALAGIYILAAANCTVQGNIVENCTQHGILSSSTYTTIQGNVCTASSFNVANTFDEINVSGNNAVVTGNTINGTSKSRYGVNFSAATTGNVCAFNVITGEQTAPYGSSAYPVYWDPMVPLAKAGSYTLTAVDTLVVFTLAGAGQTATLPSAVTAGAGRYYTISNANASTNTLGIAASAGTVPAATLAIGAALHVVSDGTNWQSC